MIDSRDDTVAISILLVDDHEIFREGVRTLLEITTDFSVLAETNNGEDGLILAKRLHPDVLLLDWVLPGMDASQVIRLLDAQNLKIHTVILSMHADEAYISSAIRLGVSGYILKEDVVGHLARAVRAAAAGHSYFSPGLENQVDRVGKRNYMIHEEAKINTNKASIRSAVSKGG
jgi:DNA-binding NarL/FixJ family response regulator